MLPNTEKKKKKKKEKNPIIIQGFSLKQTEHELYFESPVRSCVTHCIYNITLYYYFKILV